MIFTPESVRRRRQQIAREYKAGKITELEAGQRMIEADPDSGTGYIALASGRSKAGDLAGAEAAYWDALARTPCEYAAYLALAEVRRALDQDDPMAKRLIRLGLWKLAWTDEIPHSAAQFLRERVVGGTLDAEDPLSYEFAALSMDRELDALEIGGRLLPYEHLNDLQSQNGGEMDLLLLEELLAHPGDSIPLWRAALREWVEERVHLPDATLGRIIALLGETDDASIVEDLLELVDRMDHAIYLHANWAVWRLGQRFPAEVLERFRMSFPAGRATLRCAVAEQIELLPETSGVEIAAIDLLDGFAGFAKEPDAPYLLVRVMAILQERGHTGESQRVYRQYRDLLPKKSRDRFRKVAEEGIGSQLVEVEIAERSITDVCVHRALLPEDQEDGEFEDDDSEDDVFGDEEEFEAIEPVVAPVRPGRNDPCWCGSGKKYKKCHLAKDEEADRTGGGSSATAAAGKSLHATLTEQILEGAAKWHSAAVFSDANRLYFDRSPEEMHSQPDSGTVTGFFEWYIYDFRPASTGRTLVEEFLRRRGAQVTGAERDLLESWREARFGIWEVQRVEKGKGVELKDVFERDLFFVDDVSCSRSMVRWDFMVGRICQSEDRWHFAGNGFTVPRPMLPALNEQIERESSEGGQSAGAFVRANSHRLHRMVNELYQRRLDGLRVMTPEGDELEFCAAEYRVEDEASVIAGLEASKPFEAAASDGDVVRFAWLEQGEAGSRRSYGSIAIGKGKLRLECNSRKRLAIGRQLVEKFGGTSLHHLADSFQSLDAVKQKAFAGKPGAQRARESSLPSDVERELLLEVKTQHYARWIDEPVPALEGRTPREASKSESGRRALEQLFRDLENREERVRQEGGPTFDFAAVRKELGM